MPSYLKTWCIVEVVDLFIKDVFLLWKCAPLAIMPLVFIQFLKEKNAGVSITREAGGDFDLLLFD